MAQIQYDENKMFHPSALADPAIYKKLMMSNALEEWTYFDTVLVSAKINTPDFTAYDGAGYFNSFANLGNARSIPFFKTRNSGTVGQALCNMDQKDRMSVPFHLYGIAVQFNTPTISDQSLSPDSDVASLLWASLVPQHTKFSFKVGQVEKANQNVGIMPGAGGLVGNNYQSGAGSPPGNSSRWSSAYNSGKPDKWSIYEFPTPIGIARNQSIEGKVEFSDHCASEILQGMQGPGFSSGLSLPDPLNIDMVYGIQVRLLGVREVQFRNLQHI